MYDRMVPYLNSLRIDEHCVRKNLHIHIYHLNIIFRLPSKNTTIFYLFLFLGGGGTKRKNAKVIFTNIFLECTRFQRFA
jgi:hypothetical protein